jgi:hypothetical protein
LTAAAATVNTGEYTGVSGCIDHPVAVRQSIDIAAHSDIAVDNAHIPGVENGLVNCAAWARQIIDAADRCVLVGFPEEES